MTVLPGLTADRNSVVGTYFAEQVSGAAFELLSALHPGQHPSAQTEARLKNGPTTPGARRRRIQEHVGGKCTLLPALQDTDAGLLLEGEGDAQAKYEESEARRQLREANKQAETEHMNRVCARMCRGVCSMPGEAPTPSDVDIMHSLTAPLPFFSARSMGLDASKPEGNTRRRHKTYPEIFTAGFAGTELATCPQRMKIAKAVIRSAETPRENDYIRLNEDFSISVLPEDPVENFFKAVDLAGDTFSDCSPLSVDEAEDGKGGKQFVTPRRIRFQKMLTRAIYKEDGVLDTARKSLAGAEGPCLLQPAELQAEQERSSQDHLGMTGGSKAESGEMTPSATTTAGPGSGGSPVAVGRRAAAPVEDNSEMRLTATKREACVLMRSFVFNASGDAQKKKATEKEQRCLDVIGTKEQIRAVFNVWDRLDADGSGCVDIQEVRACYERSLTEGNRRPSVQGPLRSNESVPAPGLSAGSTEEIQRTVQKCIEKVIAVLNKKSISLEDLLRMLWPAAGPAEIKQMRAWMTEMGQLRMKKRVATPEVMDQELLGDLKELFYYYDRDRSGLVKVDDLVMAGLLDKDMIAKKNDGDSNEKRLAPSHFDMGQFCELMCETGKRVSAEADRGTNGEGQWVVYDKRLGGWRLDDDTDARAHYIK